MLLQHHLDSHGADANHLIMILRRLYQCLRFWLCCSCAWAVKRSMLESYEPEIQSRRSIAPHLIRCPASEKADESLHDRASTFIDRRLPQRDADAIKAGMENIEQLLQRLVGAPEGGAA